MTSINTVRRMIGRRYRISRTEMAAILARLADEGLDLTNDCMTSTWQIQWDERGAGHPVGPSPDAARVWANACTGITVISVLARGCTPHGDVRYDQPGSMAPDQHAELAFVPAECDGDECGTVGYMRRHAGRVLLVCGDQLPDPQPPAPPAPAWVKRFRRHPQVDGTWVRILEDGTLEMRDPNDGQSSDPARKCRHQYIVDDETGDLLYRRLPPATVGDEWADLGLPPWEYRDPYGSSYGGVVLDYWEMRVL